MRVVFKYANRWLFENIYDILWLLCIGAYYTWSLKINNVFLKRINELMFLHLCSGLFSIIPLQENNWFTFQMCKYAFQLRGCLHLGGWAVVQTEKWYPACRMRAIVSGVPSMK
jgi:hypothetical protein